MNRAAQDLLHRLARLHGVQPTYVGQDGSDQTVADDVLVEVLSALGVDVPSDGVVALDAAVQAAEEIDWRRVVAPTVVAVSGSRRTVPLTVRPGAEVAATVVCEDGSHVLAGATDSLGERRSVDSIERERRHLQLPESLPVGYHRLVVSVDGRTVAEAAVLCAPERLTTAEPFLARRGWGASAQLYSVTSSGSWGIGDMHDAATVAAAAAEHGADFLLLNPLHAIDPGHAPLDSPYSPVSRRFLNVQVVRVPEIPEFADLPEAEQQRWLSAGAALQAAVDAGGPIDRAAVAEVQWPALRAVHAVGRSAERQAAYERFCADQGRGLEDFASWCAVRTGTDTEDERDFHRWCQWVADTQIAAAQAAAVSSGMRLGLMLDLAVGADRHAADLALLGDQLVESMSVGAPPDMYNQLGQDWSQHPWHPKALAENGYAGLRQMLGTVMRHAGGVRIDHILGLFRLWWVPAGRGPREGAYVCYDHEAMLAVLTIEAQRAGVVVVGEDLGTFEPWVQQALADAGILGTTILWFENRDGVPTEPGTHRALAMAAVNTHDLPPTAGYLEGVHLDLRESLGLVDGDPADERAGHEHTVAGFLDAAAQLPSDPALGRPSDETEAKILALHRFAAGSPAALHAVALVDAVGERRIQNQPGTTQDQYRNWTVPLGGPDGAVVHADEIAASPRAGRLFDAVDRRLRQDVPVAVLVAFHTHPLDQPGQGDAGGLNTYVRHEAAALARTGMRPVVFTRGTGPDPVVSALPSAAPRVQAEEVTVVEVPAGPGGELSKEDLAAHADEFAGNALAWLDQEGLVADEQIAFVHGHYWLSAPAARRIAQAADAPWLHTMHTVAAMKMAADPAAAESDERRAAEREIAAGADLLVVNSPGEARTLMEVLDAPRRRIVVATPGVDTDVFTPAGHAWWPGGEAEDVDPFDPELRVLFAGRIQHHKGPQVLISALGELRRRGVLAPGTDRLRAHVNGAPSGADTPDLAALAEAEGVADLVTFSEPVPADQLAAQFRAADLVAMPSFSESYGLVALEAQACGTPVLAHRTGGLVHAVADGATGRLVRQNTPQAWADALERVLQDPASWRAMSGEAERRARSHTWDDYARRLRAAVAGL
ncbi:4-alpha-glucanotransferase [Micrococcus lylae]|uniref:4-alpha-glucanotransferase n=1 Tax=Micrococcus lylae TaxID=1273 RepID=UPI0021A5282A|nr:4-alpha-glucanotransferase [Micrococcus lylae]MCT2007245.1 4-alpha-glucanotransferase [Micrococcus lylae]MCT2070917.1 4-alpha-glucanotransferase [Micrococcus lylae]